MSTCDDVRSSLASWNAFEHSLLQFHGVCDFRRLLSGCKMEARLGMNFP